MSNLEKCPCGSQRAFKDCCELVISRQKPAESAEALMRSRYSAYTKKMFDYIYDTYHPDTKQSFSIDTIKTQSDEIRWLGLEVRETERGGSNDEDGFVSFSAKYQLHNQVHYLNERSYFKKLDGSWLYVDGETKFTSAAASQKVGRNEPCPCGSGKKYKKCCGAPK